MTNEQNLQIAAGAANAIYSANNSAGTQLVVGQALVYPPDIAGTTPGYTALAQAPEGYTVRMVNNDPQSGLNLFVAYNSVANTAIVGIAGLNGVLGLAPGAAADTAQIASGMQDQIAAMFKGRVDTIDGVPIETKGILDQLRALSAEGGKDGGSGLPFNLVIGGQSGAGPTVDALVSAVKLGLSDVAKDTLGVSNEAGTGLGGSVLASNVTVLKVNTLGSEYVLDRLGLRDQGLAMLADGASVTTVLAGDTARNYLDPVASFGGTQFGNIVRLNALYPDSLPTGPGSVLGWFHRMEGALGQYLDQGGKLSDLPTFQHTPLSIGSFMATVQAINVIPWDSNIAAYGGLTAMGLFASAFSWPGESAQVIGTGISSFLGSNSGEGFFTAVGGVIEAGLKYAAFTNPAAFVTRVSSLLFGSKLINAIMGADNTDTPTQIEAFLSKLPQKTDEFTRQEITVPNLGLMVIDTYGDRTVVRQVDGTTQTVGINGNSQIVYPGGSTLLQMADGSGSLIVPATGGALRFSLLENQTVSYLPPTDAQGNLLPGIGTFRFESTSADSQIVVQPFKDWQLVRGTPGAPVNFNYQQIDSNNNVVKDVSVSGNSDLLITTTKSNAGQVLSTRTDAVQNDKSIISTTVYQGGREEVLMIGVDQKPVNLVVTFSGPDSTNTTEKYDYVDGKPVLDSRTAVQLITNDEGTFRIEVITNSSGMTRNTFDSTTGVLIKSEPVSGGMATLLESINGYGNPLVRNGSPLIDALSMIKAIQSGQPLPIVSSGLKLANSVNTFNGVSPSISLMRATSVVGGISSLQNLQRALDKGDGMAALSASAQTITFGTQAYLAFAYSKAGEKIPTIAGTFGANSTVSQISKAAPYLAIANDLAHEDYTGAAIQAIAVGFEVPVVGWAYAAYNVINSFFTHNDPPPEPWGGASAGWSGSTLVTNAWGANGGDATARSYMNQFIAQLDALAAREQAQNPNSPIGIVANRLPTFSYRYRSGFTLNEVDPLTGVQQNAQVRYDLTGRPFNAEPGSAVGAQSFSERYIRDALAMGAVAPLWEAQTAAQQTQTGDPQAGLTEEERAGRNGLLVGAVTGSSQAWRPVALDLNGDGIQTTGANRTVAFDVDDSGFLKNTAWLSGNDGFLLLDRNLNAQLDSGKELFSNAAVDISARGLAGMRWVDANYDGKINASDPVYQQLKVWQDANGDGQVQAAEAQTLAALGISNLNYAMGTFEQNGVLKQLASPDLQADTDGTRVNVVPEGIVVQTSQGQVSLLATHIDDRSLLEANRDGITSYEDMETIVTAGDLMANDTLAGFVGQNLSLTGVSNFTHGTGYLDNNGSIHYRPDANYFGAASFNYTIADPTGRVATATVDINLQNVNDAPTATVNMSASTVVASDIDDPTASLTYSVRQQPQQGQAQINANGNFAYTNWYGPNAAGVYWDSEMGGMTTNSDPFIVRVTDPHGAFSDVTVGAIHQGDYYPSLGGGGGGGKKPIAIDMNGDGFHFTNVDDSNVFFDVNADGWRERTSWFSAGDGLLALDANGDGKIDRADEISFAGYKHGAQTDLQGLAAFDTDGDGQLTVADKDWGKFGVWQDTNQNGTTESGEFKSLDALGIAAIGLQSDGQFSVVDGQTIHGIGTVTRKDASTLNLADVTLSYSNDVQVPTADGLTDIVTRQPYSADGEPINGTVGNDLILGKSGSNVIQAFAGDDVIFEDGGNDYIDAGDGNDTVYSGADNDVVLAGADDDVVFAGNGNDLVTGGDGQDALFGEAGNDLIFGGDGNDLLSGDAGNDLLSGDLGDDLIFGGSGSDALFGMAGEDQLSGNDGDDSLNGGSGNDILDGGAGADTMLGGVGDDTYIVDNTADVVTELANEGEDTVRASVSYTLSDHVENLTLTGQDDINGTGNALNNQLIGNAGHNVLSGGAGNDTYILQVGGGQDTVSDSAGADRVLIQGISSLDSVRLDRRDQDVIVTLATSGDSLTLTNWFSTTLGQESVGAIERIELQDGQYFDTQTIHSLLDNHAPVAQSDSAAAQEDQTGQTSGNVLLNDSDTDIALHWDSRQHLSIANPGILQGQYGGLTLGADGGYSYALDNSLASVQSLGVGQLTTDVFTYTVQDNALDNKTATSTLSITITGTNDAPVVATSITTQSAREKQAFAFTVPVGTFTDIDTADTLTYSALSIDSTGTTQALPGWLSFNALTRTFSGTPGSADGGSLDFQVTATDQHGASASTRLTTNIADEFAGTGANINVITGSWTNDTLNGTSLSETLIGNGGNDTLLGGEGNNTIVSSWGNSTIIAGDGNNTITATGGDTRVTAGSGNDTITTSWGNDTIMVGDGANRINAGGGNNTITTGTGADTITADWGNNTISSGAGNDVITTTGWGVNTIDAGAGNDTINLSGGGGTVRGGLDNDLITASQWSNDTYLYARGDGQDRISDAGGQDTLVLENIESSKLWFTHSGNDLSVNVIGTTDAITLKDWYVGYQYPGSQYHVEQFKTSDGKTLLDSQVQNLVSAMAGFAPPPAGQTTLTPTYANTLAPVIAANWQ